MLNDNVKKHINLLMERYPQLHICKNSIINAYLILEKCYMKDNKLLVAGNGGSAADSEHIVGELMKCFKLPRNVPEKFKKELEIIDYVKGADLSKNLERGLMTISLVTHEALITAYCNDVEGESVFAQQLYGLGRKGDVFWGISTSGNSQNVVLASIVAKALGMKVIGLTGENGGELEKFSDCIIKVPEIETYMIQELHLPVYHCICLMLEERFFG